VNFRPSDQEQDETGIELTPLIDVVFLLLIFFMISTTFTKETKLKIKLPEAVNQSEIQNEPTMVEIHISADSEYAVTSIENGEVTPLVNSARDTLEFALRKFIDKDRVVLLIRADEKATHQAVIRILDVANKLNLNNISFATRQAIQ
jgi:biopolymer transport protein ExbD